MNEKIEKKSPLLKGGGGAAGDGGLPKRKEQTPVTS